MYGNIYIAWYKALVITHSRIFIAQEFCSLVSVQRKEDIVQYVR